MKQPMQQTCRKKLPPQGELEQFKKTVWDFYRANRRDFPWRSDITPYRVLVSEVMLQQTQVSRGEIKYREFLEQFPDIRTLAGATTAQVLTAWQGLGYNRRALHLKKAAEAVVARYGGELPDDPAELVQLPGIGPYTAGAICAFAFNRPVVFIDTNIRRVYLHHFFHDQEGIADKELIELLHATLDRERPREWYSALMDYGSTLVALHKENANKRSKHYARQSKFEGSLRQVRGKIVRLLTASPRGVAIEALPDTLGEDGERVQSALDGLAKDGLVRIARGRATLA